MAVIRISGINGVPGPNQNKITAVPTPISHTFDDKIPKSKKRTAQP
jgi:hypothetical protein